MSTTLPPLHHPPNRFRFDLLAPLRRWFDEFQIRDRNTAHLICHLIPCTCPFERTFTLFSYTIHIPPLCKLNPLYNEFVSLRFRALAYLSDVCCEDVTQYIC